MPPSTPTRRQHDRMRLDRYLAEQLRGCHADVEAARGSKSWQAVAHLRRLARQIRDDLDIERARMDAEAATATADDGLPADLTDDEVMTVILDAIAALPDQYLDQVETALHSRRPMMLVVSG